MFFDPLFLDCHAIGNDSPGDHDELGGRAQHRLNWCQLGNGLRIVCGGNGQWKRLCSSIGHVLDDYDDDDDDDDMAIGQLPILSLVPIPISVHHLGSLGSMGGV